MLGERLPGCCKLSVTFWSCEILNSESLAGFPVTLGKRGFSAAPACPTAKVAWELSLETALSLPAPCPPCPQSDKLT